MKVYMRTQELINQEYTHCAALAGDKMMRIHVIHAEIGSLQEKMKALMAEKPEAADETAEVVKNIS